MLGNFTVWWYLEKFLYVVCYSVIVYWSSMILLCEEEHWSIRASIIKGCTCLVLCTCSTRPGMTTSANVLLLEFPFSVHHIIEPTPFLIPVKLNIIQNFQPLFFWYYKLDGFVVSKISYQVHISNSIVI